VRKAKKAPLTEGALAGIRREAGKANISFEDALRISVERNWQTFRSDWYDPQKSQQVVTSMFRGVL